MWFLLETCFISLEAHIQHILFVYSKEQFSVLTFTIFILGTFLEWFLWSFLCSSSVCSHFWMSTVLLLGHLHWFSDLSFLYCFPLSFYSFVCFLNFICQPFYWVLTFFHHSKINLIDLLFFKVRKNSFSYFTDAIFLVSWSCRNLSNTHSSAFTDPHMPEVPSPLLTHSLLLSLPLTYSLHSFIYILYKWL